MLEVLGEKLQYRQYKSISSIRPPSKRTLCWLSALLELAALRATFTAPKALREKAVRATTLERAANLRGMLILYKTPQLVS